MSVKFRGSISGEVLGFQEEGRCPRNRPTDECPNKTSEILKKKGIKHSNIKLVWSKVKIHTVAVHLRTAALS